MEENRTETNGLIGVRKWKTAGTVRDVYEEEKRKIAGLKLPMRYRPVSDLRTCLVCGETVREVQQSVKECHNCGMY